MTSPEERVQAIYQQIYMLIEQIWEMDWKIQNLIKLITPHADH